MREFCDGILLATIFVCIIFMVVSAIFYFQSYDALMLNAFWYAFAMLGICIFLVWLG